MGTLDGKNAFVTGAGQGIGQGIAYALAEEGAAVAVVGRTTSKLETTVTEIEERGGRAMKIKADISDLAQIETAVTSAVDQLGGLDIVVNNAQVFNFGTILDIDLDLVDAGWRSGPLATLQTMRQAHPHLRDGGCVINITSGAVLTPAGIGAYAAAKSAIESFSRAAAVEWGPDNIRVITVCPSLAPRRPKPCSMRNPDSRSI